MKRPTQLLGVHADGANYRFDWELVRRWVHECVARGITRFEWTHLFTQWGAAHPPRVYERHGEDARLLWDADTTAASPIYTDFLAQLLPQFERFLDVEGLKERSLFHLSDEPSGDTGLATYRVARTTVRRLAPWMRVMDALSDLRFATEHLVDVPVARVPEAPSFVAHGIPAWTYFCCDPLGRYVNRLLDTPLPKIRMAGWLFYKTAVKGFLHWGYNYWYRHKTAQLIDPYQTTDGNAWPKIPSGDPFQVYPGRDGPVDSLRWEVFSESLQDLALLQASRMGPDALLLADLRDFADFPRDIAWIQRARRELLRAVSAAQSLEGG